MRHLLRDSSSWVTGVASPPSAGNPRQAASTLPSERRSRRRGSMSRPGRVGIAQESAVDRRTRRSSSACLRRRTRGAGCPPTRTDALAPSVPASACAARPSSDRTQSRLLPSHRARDEGSGGHRAKGAGLPLEVEGDVSAGEAVRTERGAAARGSRRARAETESPPGPAPRSPRATRRRVAPQASRRRPAPPHCRAGLLDPRQLHQQVVGALPALVRVLGQAAPPRGRAPAASAAGGCEIGGGSEVRIAAIRLAWLLPSNARWPVAIS